MDPRSGSELEWRWRLPSGSPSDAPRCLLARCRPLFESAAVTRVLAVKSLAGGILLATPDLLSRLRPSSTAAGTVIYMSDAVGRLVAVVDRASDAVVYTYDAVGTLLSITRQSASLVASRSFASRYSDGSRI